MEMSKRSVCIVILLNLLIVACHSKEEFKMGTLSDPIQTGKVGKGNIPRTTVGYGIATRIDASEIFEVNVESRESAWLKPGQPALVFLTPSAQSFRCRVVQVVKNASEETGQAIAWLRPETRTQLPLGEFILAKITTDFRKDIILVPKRSVLIRDGEAWVLRRSESKKEEFVPNQVKLGLEDDEHVEVISGLNGGETIVIQGGIGLLSSSFSQKGGD